MIRFKIVFNFQVLALCLQAVGVLGTLSAQQSSDFIPIPTSNQLFGVNNIIPLPVLQADSLVSATTPGSELGLELDLDSELEYNSNSGLDTFTDSALLSSEITSSVKSNVDEYTSTATSVSLSLPLSQIETKPNLATATSSAVQLKVVITITRIVLAKETNFAMVNKQTPNAPNINYNTAAVTADNWKTGMLDLLNQLRAKYGKVALQLDDRLNYVAGAHSNFQSNIRTMTHNDTLTLAVRIDKMGVKWRSIGENVAVGQKTVDQVMQGWTSSQEHFNNMIGNYDIVGFGMVSNFWTQVFVKSKA